MSNVKRDVHTITNNKGMRVDIPYHAISGVFFDEEGITVVTHHPEVRVVLFSDKEKKDFIKWWEG